MKAGFDGARALAIAHKELRHILRDPLSTKVMIVFPMVLVLFFGYAINFEVRNVDLLVSDGDVTHSSRTLIDVFDRSGYFHTRYARSIVTAGRALGEERAKAALIVPPRFEHDLLTGKPTRAQVLLDGADDETAGIITSYLTGIQEAARRRLTSSRGAMIDLRTRFLFNEELNPRWFIIPGLIVFTIGVFSTILSALTVAREWENGSMEHLLATPVQPLDIIVGKLSPYFVLCLLDAFLVYLLARLVFHVPFVGSHVVLLTSTVLFLSANLAQGLAISATMRSQRLAYQVAMQTGTWPIELLSGFVFPVENMPVVFHLAVAILPARWYMEIVRTSFLRTGDPLAVAAPMLYLALLALAFVLLAWLTFKTDLEP